MLLRLFRCLAAVVVVLSLALPFAAGQPDSSDLQVERGVKIDLSGGENSGTSSAALPYFALMVYTMLILTIMCMPSRKA